MSDLPEGWEWATLGEIAESTLGKMLDRGKDKGGTRVLYLRNVNVQWGYIDTHDLLAMEMSPEEERFFKLQYGDLLVCEGGEIGRSAVWKEPIAGVSFQKALHRVRPWSGVDSRYIHYFLMFLSSTGGLLRYATGSTIKHLPQQKLKEISIPLPPLAEQHRIVAALEDHLSHLDSGAEDTKRAQSSMATWKSSGLQKNIFGGALSASDIPEGWRIGKLGDVLDRIEAGKSFACESRPAREGEWGVIKVSAMTWGMFLETENKAVPNEDKVDERYEINPGDLLVSRANTEQYVGAPVLVDQCRSKLLLSDKSLRLLPRRDVNTEWLIAALSSPYVRKQISNLATGTKHSMRNISQESLRSVQIPIPPTPEQEVIAQRNKERGDVEGRFASALTKAQTRVEQLWRSVLREAFAGRLVEQEPNDEPASVLLERIRTERASAPKATRTRKPRAAKA